MQANKKTTMQTIKFGGIEGQVVSSSEHGNYLVLNLSDRVVVCGTYSNQWEWEESPDEDSGFKSFITYIGIKREEERDKYINRLAANHVNFVDKEDTLRRSRRCKKFPLELKIRGLSASSVVSLVQSA